MPNWYRMMKFCKASFPKCWKNWKTTKPRRDELQAKFDEVNELEDDVWNEEDYEVWQNKELKRTKTALKNWKANAKKPTRNISFAETD